MPAGRPSAFKRYSILLLIIILIGAAYYFIKIQHNEIQQNHRYLRQLNEAANSLQQSVSMLRTSIREEFTIDKPANFTLSSADKGRFDKLPEFKNPDVAKFKAMLRATQNFKHLDYVKDSNDSCLDNLQKTFCLNSKKQSLNVYINGAKITTPIADLIPTHSSPFPLLIVSDSKGNILAEKRHQNRAQKLSDVRFSSVKSYISSEAEISEGTTTSDSIDREIAGLYLRIYRQPIRLTDLNLAENDSEKTEVVYLLAFVEKREVVLNNLKVGNTAALWAVLCLILLVAILPILKIQYCAPTYSYTRSDVSQFILGLFILVGVLAIAISDQLFYRYWLQQKSIQTERLYQTLTTDFSEELNQLVKLDQFYFENSQKGEQAACPDFNRTALINDKSEPLIPLRNCTLLPSPNPADSRSYFIENWFLLGNDGNFVGFDTTLVPTIYRPSQTLYNSAMTDLSAREYFQRGWQGPLWQLQSEGETQPFFIQRIRNIHDARFNSQLVFRHTINHSKTTYLSSIGTSLTSLNQRILPNNFGFAVIDKQGQVLYHSNEERSLVENFFAENAHNLQLSTTIAHLQDLNLSQPAKLELEYQHAPHTMVIGKLHEDIPDWGLAVFYSQEEASQVNMLLVFLAVILYLLLLIPLVLLSRYLSLQGLWARILYYQHDDNVPHAFRLRYKWLAFWIWSACIMQLLSMGVINNVLPRLTFFFFTLSLILIVLQLWLVPVTSNEHKLSIKQLLIRYLPRPNIFFRTPFFIPLACGFILILVMNYLPPTNTHHHHVTGLEWSSLVVGIVLFFITSFLLWQKTRQSDKDTSKKHRKVDRLSVLTRRVSAGYLWYLAANLYLITMVPAVILINSVNGYMLEGQATFQNKYLQETQLNVSEQAKSYRKLMGQAEQDRPGLSPVSPKIDHLVLFPGLHNSGNEAHSAHNWITLLNNTSQTTQNTNASSDPLLKAIISHLYLKTHSAAQYQFMAANTINRSNEALIHYFPSRFMRAASEYYFVQILVITLLVIMGIYYAGLFLVSRKLLGEHIFDSYRLRPPSEFEQTEFIWQRLRQLQIEGNMRLQFISQLRQRDLEAAFKLHDITIYEERFSYLEDWLTEHGLVDFEKISALQVQTSTPLIIIQGLAQNLFNRDSRMQALALLRVLQQQKIDLIIVSEVSPMLLLSQAENFPAHDEKQAPSKEELWQWSKLLRDYAMHYYWVARKKSTLTTSPDALSMLLHESTHWPELCAIRDAFVIYHRAIKLHQQNHELQTAMNEDELNLNDYWSPQQIVEYFVNHARPAYRLRWEQCSTDERLTLLQLAHGAKLNPANIEAIGHLQRRGLIYRDSGWHLVNESFRQFVLSAEPASQVEIWVAKTRTSLWHNLRAPLFMLVAILFILVIFSANIAFDSVLSTLAAVLGIAPLLIQNLSSLRSVEILPKE